MDLELRTGDAQLSLRPSWGGRVTAWRWHGLDILHPMPEADAFAPEDWPKGGAYPLFPFHNRIRKGRFAFDGVEYSVPCHHSEENALHGLSSRFDWQAEQEGDTACTLSASHAGDVRWPFAFQARQRFTLRPEGLTLDLTLRNTGNGPMPAGMGWHPYFAKCSAITMDAQRLWGIDDGFFPTGDWQTYDGAPRPTAYLSDWSQADLALRAGGHVRIAASPTLSHMVLHDPAPDYSCVEPVSHLAGALNLSPERASDEMRNLVPGEELRGQITLSLRKDS